MCDLVELEQKTGKQVRSKFLRHAVPFTLSVGSFHHHTQTEPSS